MWMLKGGIGERPLDHHSTQTASSLHSGQFGTITEAPENVKLNESDSIQNDNETYRQLITGALEDIMTNYDKRIRPGYGGMIEF